MQNLKASKWRITLSNGHVVASSVMAHYFVLWTAHYFSSHRALLCPMDKTLLQVQWCTILPIGQNDVIGSMVNYFDWWMKCFLKFDCTMFHPVEKWCFKFIPALSPWQDLQKKKKEKKRTRTKVESRKVSRKNYLLFLLKYIVYARHFIYKTKKKRIETIGVNPWPTGSCYSACLRPWTGHWLAVCNANRGSGGNSYSGDKIYWLFIGTYILYARDFT